MARVALTLARPPHRPASSFLIRVHDIGNVTRARQNEVVASDLPDDILAYHRTLSPADREICHVLAAEIDAALPEATRKVWHAHPVWFLDGNPIVGYDRLKDAVRLMFWSGQSFQVDGLTASGSFKAAEARYITADDIDVTALRRWLAVSRDVQWDYEHIRTNRGLVARTSF